jgi:hypothetical protein
VAVKAWMRILRITLTTKSPGQNGKNKQLVFEENESGVGLAISVNGNKFMSTLKDNCTVKISNLTYVEIVQIITGQFYNIKIECGYKSSGVQTIFEGGVMYISNLRESVDTNTVTILCASHLVASYGQRRINLSFNSGINMYSAINFVCKVGGVPNPNISTQFKKQFLEGIENAHNQTAAEWVNDQTTKNGSYISSSDCIGNSFMTLFDANKSNARVIKLNKDTLLLTNGFPRMTADGLVFSVMPTFAFQCGDTIVMDNSLIQINVTSQSEATKNLGGLLDENGQYMIYEMHYQLENRGQNFFLEIYAKTRSRISAYLAKEIG